jgi:hypothetical protein
VPISLGSAYRFSVGLVVGLLPLLVLAFGLRLVAVPVARRRHPEVAAFIERYWPWLPLVLMFVLLAAYAWPLAVLLAAAVAVGMVVKPSAFGMRRSRW